MKITTKRLKEIIKEELAEIRTYDSHTDKIGGIATVAGATIGGLLGFVVGGVGAIPGAAVGATLGGWLGKKPAEKQQTKILAKLSKQMATEESLMAAVEHGPTSQDPKTVMAWLDERLKESELSDKEKKMLRFDESALRDASPFGEDSPATDNIISILARYGILDPNSMGVKIRKGIEKMSIPTQIKKLGDDEAWLSESTTMKVTTKRLKQIIKEETEATLSLRQESIDDVTPETIADFAWEEGIRLQDFGEPNKEPRLTMADEKRIAQIAADEAEVEIDAWGDATDHDISYDFKNFVDKVVSALWHKHKQAEEGSLEENKDWIQKAVDPDHEGYCTPMTKSTCTPARKALAKRFKKAAKKKEKKGGTGWQGKV
jgi:uncharacterized protein YcfJ